VSDDRSNISILALFLNMAIPVRIVQGTGYPQAKSRRRLTSDLDGRK